MTKFFRFILLILILGCTKKETIIEDPTQQDINFPPGNFIVTISNITDTQAKVSWTSSEDPESGSVIYDVVLGDSVVAYDLSNNYVFENLQADSQYSISVIALDSLRNENIKTIEFHTLKSWIKNIISFELGYEGYNFKKAIETNDEGMLIYGRKTATPINPDFLLKIDSGYEIEWKCEFNWESQVTSMLENSNGGYYILLDKFIVKIDEQGNELWERYFPDDYEIGQLDGLTEDLEGNILIVGTSQRKWGNDTLSVEYFISKLSPNGIEIWNRFGGNTIKNRPKEIIIESNGNITVSGLAESTGAILFSGISYWQSSFWLLKLDNEGQFLDEYIFPNAYNGGDNITQFLISYENDYLLFGTAFNHIGYSSNLPRFMMIKNDGTVIWDNYYYLSSGNDSPVISDIDKIENEAYLILTRDYDGISISSINIEGELGIFVKCRNYPIGRLIKYDHDNNYVYVAASGQIFIFNHDGYVPPN